MKTVSGFILLVAACGIISAAPADDKQTAAMKRFGKIRYLRQMMLQTLNDIEETAIEDNPEIGHAIEAKIDAEVHKIRDQIKLARIHPSDKAADLTKQIFDEMLNHFDEIKKAIAVDLQKLKPETQEEINIDYTNGVAKAKVLMEEIQGMPIS